MIEQPEESDTQSDLAAEVLARCDEVALFSEEPDKITRTFLSEPMRRLHGRLTEWMEEAGLSVRLDAAGNLIGRYDGLRPERPVLAIGSHLDTVPNAGKYDGVLGVLLGLAAVQALGGRRLPFGIDVIAFSEEEGVRYRAPFLGSLAAAGRFDRQLLERTDAAGITMADAFRSFGLDPARIDEAAYPAGGLLGLPGGPHRAGAGPRNAGGTCRRGRGDRRAEPDLGRDARPGGTRRDLADGRPARCARGGGGARAGGRAARPIDRRPAGDGRCAGRRARRLQCDSGNGAVQHRRSPRARSGPGWRPWREILARARALAEQRGVEFLVTATRASRRRPGRSGPERLARRRHSPPPATARTAWSAAPATMPA